MKAIKGLKRNVRRDWMLLLIVLPGVIYFAGKKAHRDPGAAVDEARSQEEAVEIQNVNQTAVPHGSLRGRDLIVINPHAACLQGASGALVQRNSTRYFIQIIFHNFPFLLPILLVSVPYFHYNLQYHNQSGNTAEIQ